jgi:Arc/MetJ-type ribon-helix-helix transcriptional regulator
MSTLQISLPDASIEFIRARVAERGYQDASQYILELVLADQDRKSWDELETLVLEGVRSGPSQPMTQSDWDTIRAEVRRRVGAG